jgi:hypothetical protein
MIANRIDVTFRLLVFENPGRVILVAAGGCHQGPKASSGQIGSGGRETRRTGH